MPYRIIRGKNQIGGSITEIYDERTRIYVDFGAELSVMPENSTDEIMIQEIQKNPPDAVLFTHIHGDHVGLLYAIPDEVQSIYIGPVALEMLKNIRTTLLRRKNLSDMEREKLQKELDILEDTKRVHTYQIGSTEKINTIEFMPFRADHSVFDSYMLRFHVAGECILHTGDFRNHGTLGKHLLEDIKTKLANQPVDILIIEGTMMSRMKENVLSEYQMEKKATELLRKNKYAFLICSSTNVESLASFYWATIFSARNSKRAFYVNSYVKQQLDLYTEKIV